MVEQEKWQEGRKANQRYKHTVTSVSEWQV